jgi:hypothetical protein
MARPKRFKSPARLDVIIERKTKRDAFALAVKHDVSVGRLFEQLVQREMKRLEKAARQLEVAP